MRHCQIKTRFEPDSVLVKWKQRVFHQAAKMGSNILKTSLSWGLGKQIFAQLHKPANQHGKATADMGLKTVKYCEYRDLSDSEGARRSEMFICVVHYVSYWYFYRIKRSFPTHKHKPQSRLMENLMITHHKADQQTDITVLKAAIHASLLNLISSCWHARYTLSTNKPPLVTR